MLKRIMKIARWMEKHEFIILVWLLIIMLRLPSVFEPYWYGDEGIYLTIGQALRRGVRLYSEIIDHKTPMIYWWAALAPTLFGFKLILLAASLASITLFDRLNKRWWGKGWAQKIATLSLALLTTLPALEGNIVNAELLFMPWILLGLWLFWRHKKTAKWSVFAGMAFGMAILTKVPAGFDWLALVFLMATKPHWRRLILPLTGGVSIVVILSVLWFLLLGDLLAYLRYGLFYNFTYAQAWGSPFTQPMFAVLTHIGSRLALLALYLGFLYKKGTRLKPELLLTLAWLGLALFSALLSLRPYPHYLLQVVPPLALLWGWWWRSDHKRKVYWSGLSLFIIILLTLLNFRPYPTIVYYQRFIDYIRGMKSEQAYFAGFDPLVPGSYELAAFIRLRTQPDDRVLVWSNEPMVYALSGRTPATSFIVDFHVYSMNGKKEMMKELTASKPQYVLDTRQKPEEFPELYQWLNQEYGYYQTLSRAVIYRAITR
jgi:4-amino-4-deoxy-L-arabinose transferase-like glycosyltransferase